jgi:hypothetical protein
VQRENSQFKGQGMECRVKFGNIVAAICLAIFSGMACADDIGMNPELPTAASVYAKDLQSLKSRSFNLQAVNAQPVNSSVFLLAANEEGALSGQEAIAPATPPAQFEPPWISGRKAHQYLGLGTVAFAGLTMLAAPEDRCESNCGSQPPRQTSGTTHTRLARTTAALAVATVMTGLIYHWNDIHWEDPFTDPDKMHARLAAAGALLMLYAVDKSAHSPVPTSHAPAAELGAVAMLVAIKLTW